jgi:uncharacterized membrane protein
VPKAFRVSVNALPGPPARYGAPMPSERVLRTIAGVLALAGIGVALYIAIVESGGGSPQCLAGGHGCETVAKSHYSHIAGINVAVFGIVGYVLLLGAALLPGDIARIGALGVSLVGFGFSLYLTYLELFVIDAICQWCVASAVLMTLLFIVSALRAFGYVGAELTAQPMPAHADEP